MTVDILITLRYDYFLSVYFFDSVSLRSANIQIFPFISLTVINFFISSGISLFFHYIHRKKKGAPDLCGIIQYFVDSYLHGCKTNKCLFKNIYLSVL